MEGKSMYAMYLRKSRQDMELELLGQGRDPCTGIGKR